MFPCLVCMLLWLFIQGPGCAVANYVAAGCVGLCWQLLHGVCFGFRLCCCGCSCLFLLVSLPYSWACLAYGLFVDLLFCFLVSLPLASARCKRLYALCVAGSLTVVLGEVRGNAFVQCVPHPSLGDIIDIYLPSRFFSDFLFLFLSFNILIFFYSFENTSIISKYWQCLLHGLQLSYCLHHILKWVSLLEEELYDP